MTDDKRREMALSIVQIMMNHPDLQAEDFFAVVNAVLCNSITVLIGDNKQRWKMLQAFHSDSRKLMKDIIRNETLTLN